MRKIIYTALVAFGLIACDNIAEEDRLIYEPLPEVNRSVLIEDFTGQRCVNCPTAADEIQKLQKEYGRLSPLVFMEDLWLSIPIQKEVLSDLPRRLATIITTIGKWNNGRWEWSTVVSYVPIPNGRRTFARNCRRKLP